MRKWGCHKIPKRVMFEKHGFLVRECHLKRSQVVGKGLRKGSIARAIAEAIYLIYRPYSIPSYQ